MCVHQVHMEICTYVDKRKVHINIFMIHCPVQHVVFLVYTNKCACTPSPSKQIKWLPFTMHSPVQVQDWEYSLRFMGVGSEEVGDVFGRTGSNNSTSLRARDAGQRGAGQLCAVTSGPSQSMDKVLHGRSMMQVNMRTEVDEQYLLIRHTSLSKNMVD